MQPDAARQVIATALGEIAPEIDLTEIDGAVPFAAEADLDSMDLLSLAEELHARTGVDIGDGDLPSAWSLDQLVAELARRAAD
jgi:acyl carrier protein